MKDLSTPVLWTMALLNFTISRATLTITKWNKELCNFEPIDGVPSYEVVKRNEQMMTRTQEMHNFNGESLYFMYYENDDVKFYDNDTKVSGIFGDIWTLLSDVLNFTLVAQKSEETTLGIYFVNGTYGGILEYARLNQTDIIPRAEFYRTRLPAVDFSTPFWMSGQKIFAHGYWKRNRTWMFTIFPIEIWGIILIFIVTLSLLSTISQRLSVRDKNQKIRSRTYIDHLFYTFATVCNQGELNQGELNQDNVPHHIGNGSRLLAVTISIFSWLILIGYSSHMIYSMTKEHFDAPFKDLESLFTDTNFRIAVLNGSVSDIILSNPKSGDIYYRFKAAQRVTVVPNLEELYRKVCLNMNQYVLMHGEDAVVSRVNPLCTLIPVGAAHYRTPIASGISKRVKNKRALDMGIRKLAEFGLLDAIKRRYMFSIREEASARIIDTLAIDMDRVFLIFGILGIGMILSIIICIVENIVFRLQNRPAIQRCQRRCPLFN